MSKDMWIADIGSHIAVLHKHKDGSISLVLLYGDDRFYMPMTDTLRKIAEEYAKKIELVKYKEGG